MIRSAITSSAFARRRRRASVFLLALVVQLSAFAMVGPIPAQAAASLTITPITWDVIGLDSNDQTTGPDEYSVGARVCNVGDDTATNVTATFVWDSANALISLTGSSTANLAFLDPAGCRDVYFATSVQRDAAAFDTTRQYHISVTADGLVR